MSTTKVITLVLLGGGLAFVGWQCLQNPGPGRVVRGGGHRFYSPSFFHGWGGGGTHRGPSIGGTSRGGFGGTGHAHSGGS